MDSDALGINERILQTVRRPFSHRDLEIAEAVLFGDKAHPFDFTIGLLSIHTPPGLERRRDPTCGVIRLRIGNDHTLWDVE